MTKIDELELFAEFLGMEVDNTKRVALGRLHACLEKGYHDCTELKLNLAPFPFLDYCRLGMKFPLSLYYRPFALRASLYIFIKNGRIVGGHLRKLKLIHKEDDSIEVIEADEPYDNKQSYLAKETVRQILEYVVER